MYSNARVVPKDWRDARKLLDQLNTQLESMLFSKTDPYIVEAHRQETMHAREQYEPLIQNAAIAEFQSAERAFNVARHNVDKARIAEVQRYDPQALAAHMQVVDLLIKQIFDQGANVDTKEEIEKIYTEAMRGDLNKKRAGLEVLKFIGNRGSTLDERLQLNRVADAAKRELQEIRVTDDIRAAVEKKDAAYTQLDGAYKELGATSKTITRRDPMPGSGSELEKEMYRMDIVNGDVILYKDYQSAYEGRR